MAKMIINGPTKLQGTWQTAGSKNAALPMITAALLCSGTCEFTNVPTLSDIDVLCDILRSLGATVDYHDHTLRVDATNVRAGSIPAELTAKMRASVLFLGAGVGRFGTISLSQPGGDVIGARPIASHLLAFEKMGLEVHQENGQTHISGRPQGVRVIMGELTVTGAENVIMAACLAEGTSEIRMVAAEPHVVEFCKMLVHFGARIEGIGTHDLTIHGVPKMKGGTWRIPPDQLESGSIAIAAAASRGEVLVNDFIVDEHDSLLTRFDEIGVRYTIPSSTSIHILPGDVYQATNIRTQPYPNFPSDLQAPMAVLLTQATGTSEIFETLYEGRLHYLYELQRMGATVGLRDAHTGFVTGPSPLFGTDLISFDIRAGATILLAAIIAQGQTVIDRIEHIDRGHERFDARLRDLGADIQRVE